MKCLTLILFAGFVLNPALAMSGAEPEFGLGVQQNAMTWVLSDQDSAFIYSVNLSPNVRLFLPTSDHAGVEFGLEYPRISAYRKTGDYWSNPEYVHVPIHYRFFASDNFYLLGGIELGIKTNEYCTNGSATGCPNDAAQLLVMPTFGLGINFWELWGGRTAFEALMDYSVKDVFPGAKALNLSFGLIYRHGI
jgi:hypothetical protein